MGQADNVILFQEYVIPKEFIKKTSKYLVYGHGKVGKTFCYQLFKNQEVQFLGAVDKNVSECQANSYAVYEPQAIKELNFDYIIVSLLNEEIAQEAINFLTCAGVDKEKILWAGEKYVNKKVVSFPNQRNVNERNFFLFMLPEHGNLGDYAIGYAEMKFFKEYFPDDCLYCITSNQWKSYKTEIINQVKENDIIFFNGGGYLGTLWGDNEEFQELCDCFVNNVKIFLPNNFTFKEELSEQNEDFVNCISWMNKTENIFLFFRTKASYEIAKKYFTRAYYFPDMALNLFSRREVEPENKILLCLRNDREKNFDRIKDMKELLDKKGILFEEWDINLEKHISQIEGLSYVHDIIRKIQSYKMVVTDRLHGMILATISQVPVVAFDNSTHKVQGVYDWLKDVDSVVYLENHEIEKVVELSERIINAKTLDEDGFRNYFDRMAVVIENIIKEEKSEWMF